MKKGGPGRGEGRLEHRLQCSRVWESPRIQGRPAKTGISEKKFTANTQDMSKNVAQLPNEVRTGFVHRNGDNGQSAFGGPAGLS